MNVLEKEQNTICTDKIKPEQMSSVQIKPEHICSGKVPCPVETSLSILGGKWKGIILYRLLPGKRRFNELRREINGITHRVLTLQLRELEADHIIKRTVYAEVPPKVEYELTEFGRTVEPIIIALYEWGKLVQSNEDLQ
ncbi:MAG: putative transcriptional regulator [Anaerocolumna sp.]|jgi:DNA-binding HxlR family transcriptional regulator|nr:putative transcriptional regulator [Anaerocolumna sp.]